MKLMTRELERAFEDFPLYSQDGKGGDALVIAKYFSLTGGRWYITEASRQPNGDWLMFGFMDLGYPEYGYVALSQLQSVGSMIERDIYFPIAGLTVREACRQDGVPYKYSFNLKAPAKGLLARLKGRCRR